MPPVPAHDVEGNVEVPRENTLSPEPGAVPRTFQPLGGHRGQAETGQPGRGLETDATSRDPVEIERVTLGLQ